MLREMDYEWMAIFKTIVTKSSRRKTWVNGCVKLKESGSFDSPQFICLNFLDHWNEQITDP